MVIISRKTAISVGLGLFAYASLPVSSAPMRRGSSSSGGGNDPNKQMPKSWMQSRIGDSNPYTIPQISTIIPAIPEHAKVGTKIMAVAGRRQPGLGQSSYTTPPPPQQQQSPPPHIPQWKIMEIVNEKTLGGGRGQGQGRGSG